MELEIKKFNESNRKDLLRYREDVDKIDSELSRDMDRLSYPLSSERNDEVHSDGSWLNETFARKNDTVILGILQGKVVGVLNLKGSRYEKCMVIASVFVVKKHRSKGIGKALLSAAYVEAIALRAKHVILNVSVNNTSALNLYRKDGFEPIVNTLCKKL
jgi:ribosomal protein S18 acetylase RimI-like enzyme